MAEEYVPYEGPIVTRSQAREHGLVRYFTAKPCKYGHLAERFVSVGHCLACRGNPSRIASEEAYKFRNRQKIAEKSALWRVRNPERASATSKAYREANRGNLAEAKRADYAARADEMRRSRRARYAEDPLKHLAINAKWAAANPEKVAALRRNRRACKRQATGSHTADDIKHLWRLQNGKCASDWCRADLKASYHIDHIYALARGGSNDRSNLQLLCVPCNLSKHAKDPIDWAREHGRLL